MNEKAVLFLSSCLALLPACRPPAADPAGEEHVPPKTDRIDVPEAVQRNLGIQFATVQRRAVAATLRVPGHFELLPQARYEHRTPMAGRVEIRVQPLQPVAAGDVLYTIDAPEWRAVQRQLGEIDTDLFVTAARVATMKPLLAAHKTHEESLREAVAVMQERVKNLEATRQSVGGQAQEIAEAKVQLAQVRSQGAEAAEKHTETEATIAELEANQRAGRERFQLVLAGAAATIGVDAARLAAAGPGAVPLWRTLGVIEVRTAAAGIVDQLPVSSGAWVEPHELVLTVTDLDKVRFRARGLQSDLHRLRPGLPARIVTAAANADPGAMLTGPLQLGAEADPAQRTIDLFLVPSTPSPSARPGVAAFLEIETRTGAGQELAIPLGAVMQDGLDRVFFRRDPANRDKVIRVEADLGVDDGRWVEVKSGIVDGDEIVTAGAYALMLASSGSAAKGGHFHADGSWHEDH